LLGLLKHVTYVEGVWFDQAGSGRSFEDIGIASTPDRSFTLRSSDTIAGVKEAHRQRCEVSRRTMGEQALDTVVDGRGDRPVWALQLQCCVSRAALRARGHPAGADPGPMHQLTRASRGLEWHHRAA